MLISSFKHVCVCMSSINSVKVFFFLFSYFLSKTRTFHRICIYPSLAFDIILEMDLCWRVCVSMPDTNNNNQCLHIYLTFRSFYRSLFLCHHVLQFCSVHSRLKHLSWIKRKNNGLIIDHRISTFCFYRTISNVFSRFALQWYLFFCCWWKSNVLS